MAFKRRNVRELETLDARANLPDMEVVMVLVMVWKKGDVAKGGRASVAVWACLPHALHVWSRLGPRIFI